MLGADARIGELAGEYCAGAHSINVGGRIKVAGIAQRVVKHGAATSAVVVAGGGPALRAADRGRLRGTRIAVDPATAGALDEALPGLAVEQVAHGLQDAYAADRTLEPRALDASLIDAARAAGAATPRARPLG